MEAENTVDAGSVKGALQDRVGEGYLTYEDKAVWRYIEQHIAQDDYYDEEIADNEAFGVHFHLSSLRRGILSWYDFKPEASLLELGAGFGALTGFFCEKCIKVTAVEESEFRAEALRKRHSRFHNLQVLTGRWQEMQHEGLFDYVVLYDSIQCDSVLLNKLACMLKPQGKLLISFQNCFGLNYLCGAPERHTGKLFGGIRGYAGSADATAFSRNRICKELEQSIFSKFKFYYPLPDDRMPQMIYTDAYLPEKNVVERILAYCEDSDILFCKIAEMYGKVIENGDFSFLANSFLVECTTEGTLCDTLYAAISADRGTEGGFATVIHESKIVCKKPLYPEGWKGVQRICDNTDSLRQHGLQVVPYVREGEGISMPYIGLPTLADYIREKVMLDSNAFRRILSDLYSHILMASEEVEVSENALILHILRGNTSEEVARIKELDWGPILKHVYVEMVPLNCFYEEETGRYLFFDQEYVRENYPANYVMFRTLAICYNFIPELEAVVPLQKMKDEFGLSKLWPYYEKEEILFLDEIRLRNRYRQLYKWVFFEYRNPSGEIDAIKYIAGRKQGKKLILFGTGRIFEKYCASYNRDMNIPIFAVDNDSTKWGQMMNGIEIRPPKSILEIPREKRQILICCKQTAQIENQLEEMGIYEYWKYQPGELLTVTG